MVLPKTPKQCVIKINSLKRQLGEMEKRKKKLAVAKPAKKKVAKKKVARKKVSKKRR